VGGTEHENIGAARGTSDQAAATLPLHHSWLSGNRLYWQIDEFAITHCNRYFMIVYWIRQKSAAVYLCHLGPRRVFSRMLSLFADCWAGHCLF
jgi:hypothetical protein